MKTPNWTAPTKMATPAFAAFESAIACYRGELLPTIYDDWILSERERLRQALLGALEQLSLLLEYAVDVL